MKEYTVNQSMNLECLILNPAFIEKQPRQICSASGQRGAGEMKEKQWSADSRCDTRLRAVGGRSDSCDHRRPKAKGGYTQMLLMSSEDWMVFKAMGVAAVIFIAALFF